MIVVVIMIVMVNPRAGWFIMYLNLMLLKNISTISREIIYHYTSKRMMLRNKMMMRTMMIMNKSMNKKSIMTIQKLKIKNQKNRLQRND